MGEPITEQLTIPANGWQFSGRQWGAPSAPTVLLLHGFPQTASSWGAAAGRLADAGLHVVAIDQRGYSPGARPPEVAAYALPALVADVVALVDALGAPVHLAGHDWGAVVGWQVAARHPERVRSWVAVSTPNPLALNRIMSGTDPAAEQQLRAFGYMPALRDPAAESRLLADDAAGLRALYGGIVPDERIAEDLAVLGQPGALTAALNWYRAMDRTDAAGLGPVAVPTSYVWGSADVAFQRPAAEATAAFVTAPYDFVEVDGASHWLPDEAADTVADVIARRALGR